MGAASLAGLATMLVLVPIQGAVMRSLGARRGAIARATDQRIKVTNEALQGIPATLSTKYLGTVRSGTGSHEWQLR